MKITIKGKNVEITESIRKAIEERLEKFDKYFTAEASAEVLVSVEKFRQKIEIVIPMKGASIRSEQESNDLYVSIDLAAEVLERQLRKYKNKIIDRKQGAGLVAQAFEEETGENELSILRTKNFDMKPMFPEDACLEMELLGHDFYMFLNAETDSYAVVYKRKGGKYGMISPA